MNILQHLVFPNFTIDAPEDLYDVYLVAHKFHVATNKSIFIKKVQFVFLTPFLIH